MSHNRLKSGVQMIVKISGLEVDGLKSYPGEQTAMVIMLCITMCITSYYLINIIFTDVPEMLSCGWITVLFWITVGSGTYRFPAIDIKVR